MMQSQVLQTVDIAILTALLAGAVYTDLRFGKIYNKLTIPCIMLGVALSAARGLPGILDSLAAIGLVLVLYLFFAPAAGIGGGDAKLVMGVAALVGLKLAVWAMLFSAIIGGVLALAAMARYRALLSTTRNMAGNLYLSAVLRAPVELSSGSKGIKFRYSPAIALGTVLAFFVKLW
ncbi:MAG TPA: A24 family peptidase [Armatimonadota bacterium]|nr:A24 family peptidase [Armatimonadota bacterium]